MFRTGRFALSFALLLAVVGCEAGGTAPRRDGGNVPDGSSRSDSDGDTISDADEGIALGTDTDGDGTPDFQDDDSDGDGIPDSVEAGDLSLETPPVDSDGDSTPDFQDLDADGNAILDADETPGDVDADGTLDFADLDDDNDGITDSLELMGVLPPIDFDGDGANDYQDPDSDNDTILDGHERDADTDGDGLLDVHDLDSDDDTLSDAVEAGDADMWTVPVDSELAPDGVTPMPDGIPDFRDSDSDNDGLSDLNEATLYGTSPTDADTDNDGVSDLIEIAGGTDPTDGTVNPRTEGNFVFLVPYEADPDPPDDTLTFRTSIQFADVYFLLDASGSMSGEINGLRIAINTVITNLTCTDTLTPCVADAECASGNICNPFSGTCTQDPSMSTCVASIFSGAGYYEVDYWHTGGRVGDGIRLQNDPAATAAAMAMWTTFGGTERLNDAVLGIADPSMTSRALGCETPAAGFIGCPAYREEAVRILVAITDEPGDGGSASTAAAALVANGITFIGVNSRESGSPLYAPTRTSLQGLANMSGSLGSSGMPLYVEGEDAAIVPEIVNAINEVVEGVPLRVTIGAVDQPGDAGDSIQFIAELRANVSDPGCTSIPFSDAGGTPRSDEFPSVTPGTPVCFDVVALMNTMVMPELIPLVFEAQLTVFGDGSPLDTRRVFFLVPPRIEEPGGPD